MEDFQESSDDLDFKSIPSELIRSFHSKPQVNVKVGDLYALCTQNCDINIQDDSGSDQNRIILDKYTYQNEVLTITLVQDANAIDLNIFT